MKDKRCKGYCSAACLDGCCPIALYNEDFTLFEIKPSCEDCLYYKGCEDCIYCKECEYCYFENTDKYEKGGEG